MQLTERDVEILRFINDFGFCEISHIGRRFQLKNLRSYKIMKRLIRGGLVAHERVFHNRPGAYFLTRAGAKYTPLPPIYKIPKDLYKHQIAIIDVYFKLIQLYPDATWLSERVLKRDKFTEGFGRTGHLADGKLIMPDQKRVAIEVELTMKSRRRLEQIFRAYTLQIAVKEVWYFCAPDVYSLMKQAAAKKPFIKIHQLEEEAV